tara:strand:+ start:1127 stop:1501 length:375 start_codon:yes stop_codon:yes gene_type:complete
MANYYCTCQSERGTKRQNLREHKKLHTTIVDSEGICKHCGYYAIAKPNSSHVHFPRTNYKKWETEPINDVVTWSKHNLTDEYYWYFHGHGCAKQGLNAATLKRDQEKISNERKQNLKRANGNRG